MSTPQLLLDLQNSALGGAIRGDTAGSEWLFPILETLHVLGSAIVFGSIAVVDARLLGLLSRSSSFAQLHRALVPWSWWGFLVSATSGSLLFISKADTYWNNWETRMKFLFLLFAGLNMLVFELVIYRGVNKWDTTTPTPAVPRLAGALSLAFWITVIFFGRWIGFTT